MHTPPPIIWSIAGLDPSGGAGLSADTRAGDAMGVHVCPVLACATAQSTQGVTGVWPLSVAQLNQQLSTLAQDMPPAAIKTGLLGSVDLIIEVAQWVDRLRAALPAGSDVHRQLPLVVDPVFKASSQGLPFDSDAIVAAYREHLLPRATVVTPNLAEAQRLLHIAGQAAPLADWPALATQLQQMGAQHVVITGGDTLAPGASHHALDWMQTYLASGWLSLPRLDTRHTHGTGCTFATGVASAMARGHVAPDAVVLAKMLTHHAIAHGHAAGGHATASHSAGPVQARAGFAQGPAFGGAPMPYLGIHHALPWLLTDAQAPTASGLLFQDYAAPRDGLYGIVQDAGMVQACLDAGMDCVQLRHKSKQGLAPHLQQVLHAAQRHAARVFINDHWRETLQAWAPVPAAAHTFDSGARIGLHLGQEDLCALTPNEVAQLQAARTHLMLGLSSHSLWELARALGCGPSYVACGPVQATTTKDMPWHPQGEHNLRWWVQNSPRPVVAIGGILDESDLRRFRACQPAALCVVRALGTEPAGVAARYSRLRQAVQVAAPDKSWPLACPALPQPVL